MPRQLRYQLPGMSQHIIQRGNNLVRVGMVPHPVAYPWSSYRWHALGEPNPVMTDHALYLALGSTLQERQTAYRALFQYDIDDSVVQEIRATLQQCRVLGTERFKDAIERMVKRRVRPGKPGRRGKRTGLQLAHEAIRRERG